MPAEDPLTELDRLVSQLANLERQFSAREIPPEQFEPLAKQLKDRIINAESLAYAMARKDKLVAKRLRLRNYNDPMVQQVCSHFIFGPGEPLQPRFGADRLPKYYVEPEKGREASVDQDTLQRMAGIGILTETLFEKLLYCPQCTSPSDVFTRFKCPQCSSIDVSMDRMIEHLQCGTIHQETAFLIGPNMICPTCKKPIQQPDEYRLIGLVCNCTACGAHFGDPVESFYCRKCQIDFGLPTARVVSIYTYTMESDALEEARSYLGIPEVARILREEGFDVTSPGTLTSPSGEDFEFAILARKDMKMYAIELSQSNLEVGVEAVLEFYVKLIETKPTAAIFAAVPKLSRKAQGVASLHNIIAAEGPTAADVAKTILAITRKI